MGRRLGSGLLAVGVDLGVGWGWIAFFLARQLRGLGLQNLEMSQPQTLGRLGADRARRPRLAENSEIGGVANSSPSIHAARSSSVLKFLSLAYVQNLRNPVLHTWPPDQSSTPSSDKVPSPAPTNLF